MDEQQRVSGPLSDPSRIETEHHLAQALRELRRRHARDRNDSELTYRELAARTGYAHGAIGDYFTGKTVPPTDRFDVLITLLGAGPAEQGALAAARDRVHDSHRDRRPANGRLKRAPRELRPDVSAFTGRDTELTELDRLLADTGEQPATVVISAVCGTAGVGKTALATHWAHRIRHRFPDGDLYVDLRGYDPAQPLQPTDALAGMLRRLGVAGEGIPEELAERAALFRTLMADRRMLVVLDNAYSVGQVHDLLPGTPSCLVIVTSRDSLAGLIARHGAHRINLDLLPVGDAVALLRAVLGSQRVDADPVAAVALAACCARLPLALRVAAELAVARPIVPLSQLVAELETHRLDMLDSGDDDYTAVRAVFSWSYKYLDAAAGRAFRLLGLHPGRDIDTYALAALTGTDRAFAGRLLDSLVRASLVAETASDRFGMHDLLRAYAAEQAELDTEEHRREALTRLFDYYLGTSSKAMDLVAPTERHERPDVREPTTPIPPLHESHGAVAWLEAERPNLLTVARHAATHDWPNHTVLLSAVLCRYFDRRAYFTDGMTLHTLALMTARAAGNTILEGQALHRLGTAHMRLGHSAEAQNHLRHALTIASELDDSGLKGRALQTLGVLCMRLTRYAEALAYLERALPVARQTENRHLEGHVLRSLGGLNRMVGRYEESLTSLQQALALARETADPDLEGQALNGLGLHYQRVARHDEALAYHLQALALARNAGHRSLEAASLDNVGLEYLTLGRHNEALAHLDQSLAIARETGNRVFEGYALTTLGRLCVQSGRVDQAAARLREALAIARDTGNRDLEVDALDGLGEAAIAAGDPRHATEYHRQALDIARETGDRWQEARAHEGLANAYYKRGLPGDAREHHLQAHAIHNQLGVRAEA